MLRYECQRIAYRPGAVNRRAPCIEMAASPNLMLRSDPLAEGTLYRLCMSEIMPKGGFEVIDVAKCCQIHIMLFCKAFVDYLMMCCALKSVSYCRVR